MSERLGGGRGFPKVYARLVEGLGKDVWEEGDIPTPTEVANAVDDSSRAVLKELWTRIVADSSESLPDPSELEFARFWRYFFMPTEGPTKGPTYVASSPFSPAGELPDVEKETMKAALEAARREKLILEKAASEREEIDKAMGSFGTLSLGTKTSKKKRLSEEDQALLEADLVAIGARESARGERISRSSHRPPAGAPSLGVGMRRRPLEGEPVDCQGHTDG